MDNRPILFLDSGIGCLPYGRFFHSRNESERLVCIGDSANFPYGIKSREEVIKILDTLTDSLISFYDPKILALVCNTATVSGLDFLREKYPEIPIVGTVPAIKPAVTASRTRRVGVIGTERTVEDPYISKLAERCGNGCEIIKIGAPDLVDFAEKRYWVSTPAERLSAVRRYVEKFRAAGADSIVLSCTHFLLLYDDFLAAAGSDIAVFDSVEGVSRRIESILDNDGLRASAQKGDPGEKIVPLIAVTGNEDPEPYWEPLAALFGFTLEKKIESRK